MQQQDRRVLTVRLCRSYRYYRLSPGDVEQGYKTHNMIEPMLPVVSPVPVPANPSKAGPLGSGNVNDLSLITIHKRRRGRYTKKAVRAHERLTDLMASFQFPVARRTCNFHIHDDIISH